jgi:hypothetical protein
MRHQVQDSPTRGATAGRSFASLAVVTAALLLQACAVQEAGKYGDPEHPLDYHPVLPLYGPNTGQIAAGVATGRALDQPIGFSHLLHAGELKMDCQYCHSEARKSIHAGVPPLQTCMGCHSQIRTDSPEIQLVHTAWCGQPTCTVQEDAFGQPVREAGAKPIPWNKVHDVPDYVHFNHSRHVVAGVNCTECHGQVQLQGEYELVPIPGGPEGAQTRKVDQVMIREGTLQMGWCIRCHQTHPSVDQNYGDQAALRRAELKDCWTCHK